MHHLADFCTQAPKCSSVALNHSEAADSSFRKKGIKGKTKLMNGVFFRRSNFRLVYVMEASLELTDRERTGRDTKRMMRRE